MHNWDYDQKTVDKADVIWKLERLLNYGLAGEKINQKELEENFNKIKIPENTRAFLELLIWNKQF